MDVVELVLRVSQTFDKHRVPFMVFGGVAMSIWVEARQTRDVDIKILARRKDAPRLKPALIESGARVTAAEMRWIYERRFVRLKTTDGPKLDVHLVHSAHDRTAFAHAPRLNYRGQQIRMASAEDLVLYKLQAWRDHDQMDVRAILREVRKVDHDYVESWLDRITRESGAPMRERWTLARAGS